MKVPPPPRPRAPRLASRARRRPQHITLPPGLPFHAFIGYADVPAARRAMGTINEVLELTPQKYRLSPMLWRFGQLVDGKWRETATTEAAQASVIVLASSAPTTLNRDLESWIADVLARRRGLSTTVVALLGEEDSWTISIEEPQSATAAQRLVA